MKAPFPWFGGKSRAAPMIWQVMGNTPNYVEPFAGSLATLLLRPHPPGIETVNDADGFVANFWRALAADPDAVAHWADWPVNEVDLHARHAWLVPKRAELTERLMGDPDYYDVKIAGWWVWGICAWIGTGWCSGEGPWQSVDGRLVRAGEGGCIARQRPRTGTAGVGVHRSSLYTDNSGKDIHAYLNQLSARLRRVRVVCGDWTRVTGPAVTGVDGLLTGVLLDPPYVAAERAQDLYSIETDCAAAVREWAIENGNNPKLRIVLCGYEGQEMPSEWTVIRWKTNGGYGSQGNSRGRVNKDRETLWCSPHCLRYGLGLFDESA